MRAVAVVAGTLCVLWFGGCGLVSLLWSGGNQRAPSDTAARNLSAQVLPGGYSPADLAYVRRQRDGRSVTGYLWRVATGGGGRTSTSTPTHLGVLACVQGDQATEVARFSYLHHQSRGCEGGTPVLEEASRTREQDERALGQEIQAPQGIEDSPEVARASG
jgi:hypothetical protein